MPTAITAAEVERIVAGVCERLGQALYTRGQRAYDNAAMELQHCDREQACIWESVSRAMSNVVGVLQQEAVLARGRADLLAAADGGDFDGGRAGSAHEDARTGAQTAQDASEDARKGDQAGASRP